jgi:hypothetical protein
MANARIFGVVATIALFNLGLQNDVYFSSTNLHPIMTKMWSKHNIGNGHLLWVGFPLLMVYLTTLSVSQSVLRRTVG